jgi:hypothetical protein
MAGASTTQIFLWALIFYFIVGDPITTGLGTVGINTTPGDIFLIAVGEKKAPILIVS